MFEKKPLDKDFACTLHMLGRVVNKQGLVWVKGMLLDDIFENPGFRLLHLQVE